MNPGPIDTDMNPAGGPFQELVERTSALGRYGTADEVGAVVAFLAGRARAT